MPKLKTLVLKTKKWCRGDSSDSGLLVYDGMMCCLGFLARDCGLKPKHIRGLSFPSETKSPKFPKKTFTLESRIAEINDCGTISDEARLRKLRPHFRKLGYKLELQ